VGARRRARREEERQVTMTVCSNSLGYYERAGEGERRSDAVAGRAGVGGASWVDTCWVERESKGLRFGRVH
jgi:hypothetical protein